MAAKNDDGDPGDSWSGLWQELGANLKRTFLPVLIPLVAMWILFLINAMTGNWLNVNLGLRPRSLDGLAGILFMPMLHGGLVHSLSITHILGNTFSWVVLGGMVSLITRRFTVIMALIWVLSGVILWVIGTPWAVRPDTASYGGLHVGASGIIYGFAAFLVAYGFLARRVVPILFALFVIFFYGISMLLGMLPVTVGSGVSWTGHLSGTVAGIVAAFLMTKEARADRTARASSTEIDRGY